MYRDGCNILSQSQTQSHESDQFNTFKQKLEEINSALTVSKVPSSTKYLKNAVSLTFDDPKHV